MTRRPDPLVAFVAESSVGFARALRLVWRHRLAIGIALAYYGLAWLCGLNYPTIGYWSLGLPDRVWAFALLGSLPWIAPDSRRYLLAAFASRRLRGRFDAVMRELGLVNDAGKAPRIRDGDVVRVEEPRQIWGLAYFRVRYDVAFDVVLPVGADLKALSGHTGAIAAALRVKTVRIEAIPDKPANLVHMTVLRREPFRADDRPARWPHRHDQRRSLWDPIAVARDEQGRPFTVSLFQHNVMVAGLPGGGKSVLLNVLAAAAALDPHAHLHLMDGKGGLELEPWADCATSFVGSDPDKAVELLEALAQGMDHRYEDLRRAQESERERVRHALAQRAANPGPFHHRLGRWLRPRLAPLLEDRTVPRFLARRMEDPARARLHRKVSAPTPLHLLVVDELPSYVVSEQGKRIVELLTYIVQRGRAAGVIVCAGAQKPEGHALPTNLRDLFSIRVSFAATSSAASDVALGQGWASRGYNAALIDSATPGVCWWLGEGGVPARLRTYFLADDEVPMIAERGAALRGRTRSEAPEPEDVIDVEAVEIEAEPDADDPSESTGTVELVIDALPPSKNVEDFSNTSNGSGSFVAREHRREWKALIVEAAEKAELPRDCEHIACTATFRFEKANRRDPQNFWHNAGVVVPDALVEAGYLPDDTQDHWTPMPAVIQKGTGKARTTLRLEYRVRVRVEA